jgi:tRNA (cytidine/uridine-2'-O-)-methyltransferase
MVTPNESKKVNDNTALEMFTSGQLRFLGSMMFNIVLVEPEIPPNTGNVIRLAANTGCHLHLVEPLGFSMDDKHMRRAGLDYHEYAKVIRHANWQAFLDSEKPAPHRLFAMTTQGARNLYDAAFLPGDWLVFGAETRGLSEQVRKSFAPSQRLKAPMKPGQRSLNLSNTVALTVFEAWRQNGFDGMASITAS